MQNNNYGKRNKSKTMKKFISVLIILIAVVGVCIFEEIYLNNFKKEFLEKADNVYTIISNNESNINNDNINSSCENLYNYWNNSKRNICYFANYEKIKGIDESFIKLKTAIKNNDKALAMENIAVISNTDKFFEYMVGFNINNLF